MPLSTAPGRYLVVVCADATRRVRESDERDDGRVGPAVTVTRRGGSGGGTGSARGSLGWTFVDDDTGEDWLGHEEESGTVGLVLEIIRARRCRMVRHTAMIRTRAVPERAMRH